MTNVSNCLSCGNPIPRGTRESQQQFERRRYCSRSCFFAAPKRPTHRKANYDAKSCQICGRTFERPENQRGNGWSKRVYCSVQCVNTARRQKAWEHRPVIQCAICKTEFRSSVPNVRTCGSAECKRRYKREIAAPAQAATVKAAYAAGRKPAEGISPREKLLWPLLIEHGWSWRLRWQDATGDYEIDFSHPDLMIAVEIDGVEHTHPARRRRDEARDARLAEKGWRVVRYLNAEVDADPAGVAAQILSLA